LLLHFAVSLGDAFDEIRGGKLVAALKILASGRNLESLSAVLENARILSRLARTG
jgi:hypothetical protein